MSCSSCKSSSSGVGTDKGVVDDDRGKIGVPSESGRDGGSGTSDAASDCAVPQAAVVPAAAALGAIAGNSGCVGQNPSLLAPITVAEVEGGGEVGVDARSVGLTKELTSDCSSCEGQTWSTATTVMCSMSSKRPRTNEN